MRFFSRSTALTLAAAATLAPTTLAYKDGRTFAVMHFYGDKPLVVSRTDPIVNPGEIAHHLHHVMGGNAFSAHMPGGDAMKSTCTNANVRNDKSNYWTPSLFFRHDDGTFSPVDMYYMNVYYFFDYTDDEIMPFPEGFRMVAGDADLRSPPKSGTGAINVDTSKGHIQPVQFTCPRQNTAAPLYPPNSNGKGGVGIVDPMDPNSGAGFPDQNCDGMYSPLRADIHFPSCYNPKAGPANYKHNTAYPSTAGTTWGAKFNCPEGWIHVPHLFFEVYWNTQPWASQWTPGQGKQPFVLSNGDPTGYGLHGDFVNGWDAHTLKTIIETCNAGDLGIDKCPNIPGGLTTNDPDCYAHNPYPEHIHGNMKKLPGCNPLEWGPHPATKDGCPAHKKASKKHGHGKKGAHGHHVRNFRR